MSGERLSMTKPAVKIAGSPAATARSTSLYLNRTVTGAGKVVTCFPWASDIANWKMVPWLLICHGATGNGTLTGRRLTATDIGPSSPLRAPLGNEKPTLPAANAPPRSVGIDIVMKVGEVPVNSSAESASGGRRRGSGWPGARVVTSGLD